MCTDRIACSLLVLMSISPPLIYSTQSDYDITTALGHEISRIRSKFHPNSSLSTIERCFGRGASAPILWNDFDIQHDVPLKPTSVIPFHDEWTKNISRPSLFYIDPYIVKHAAIDKGLVQEYTAFIENRLSRNSFFDMFYNIEQLKWGRKLAVFENVWIDKYGLIVSPDRCRSVRQGGCNGTRSFDSQLSTVCRSAPLVISLDAAMTGVWHFPMEVLVGISKLDMNSSVLRRANIHLPNDSPYVKDWMHIVGIDVRNRMVTDTVHSGILLAPQTAHCGQPFIGQVDWLVRRVTENLKLHSNSVRPLQVLLVHRRSRRINNILEVYKVIKDFVAMMPKGTNFVIHSDKNLPSLSTQLKRFADTDFVIAPHGAAELFTAFMKPGSYVVEFINYSTGAHVCYSTLAYTRGLNYHQHAMSPANTINLDKLSKTLSEFWAHYSTVHGV